MELQAKSVNVIDRYLLETLIALELLMSFSFLGYFHVEPISITIAYIPVLIAGALLSPKSSALVGLFFGLASMWKASASYVMPADQLFSPMLSENPAGSLMLSVGSRVLFGLAIGLLYGLARRLRHPIWGIALVSFVASTLHSFLVYSAMYLFFPEAGYSPMDAFSGFFSPTELLSNAVIAAVVVLLWLASRTQAWQKFQQRLAFTHALQTWTRYHRLSMVIMTALTLAASLAVTAYFVHRIDYVLEGCGIDLTGEGYMDIFHLQIQFLFGIISLMVLVILFLILNRQYNSYQAYEGKLDSLTGALVRRAFFSSCGRALRSLERQDAPAGYFIMVDLDDFKTVNDLYGHPEGDRALKEVAQCLKELFGHEGIISRLGGDEFAVLLYQDVSRAELEVDLRHFLSRVRKIAWEDRHLTCSVGALPIRSGYTPEELYHDADQLLYAAKEQGRDQFVIGADTATQAVAP